MTTQPELNNSKTILKHYEDLPKTPCLDTKSILYQTKHTDSGSLCSHYAESCTTKMKNVIRESPHQLSTGYHMCTLDNKRENHEETRQYWWVAQESMA